MCMIISVPMRLTMQNSDLSFMHGKVQMVNKIRSKDLLMQNILFHN